ncbi:lin-17 [Pristionchus pacificus]|nr:lin-17 [Pristionchus pacificus]
MVASTVILPYLLISFKVKRECVSIIEEFGLQWPELLECSKFPAQPDLCMQPMDNVGQSARPTMSHFPRLSSSQSCPSFLVDTDEEDPMAPCALPCKGDVLFSTMHKNQLSKWLPGVAIASCAFSAFAFLTFLIDRSRFRFPERCIFYLSLCYLCYSLPFLVVGLDPQLQPACSQTNLHKTRHLLLGHMDSSLCTISFFLTYYFSMSAALWWFMFAFTWYLSATRKWVPESLEAASIRVHVVAWFGPLVAAIVVVMTHSVDSSELTGLCGVGNTNRVALLFYSFLPRAVIGCVATLFLLTGITSMCRERNNFKDRGTDTSKLDKLMLKTCLFLVVYVVLWLATLAADLYHYAQLQAWQDATIGCKQSGSPCLAQPPRPNGDIYLMQVLAPLFAFIGPFIWSFSLKTFSSFKRRICCCIWHPTQAKTPSRQLLDASGSGMCGTVPGIPLPQPPAPRHQHEYVPLSTSSQPRWQHNHV